MKVLGIAFLFQLLFGADCTDWMKYGFDLSISGYNPSETIITQSMFNSKTLSLSWSLPINGASVSQPLYVSGVSIQGSSVDLVLIGTELGDYFAIDATTGSTIWTINTGAYIDTSCTTYPGGSFGISGTGYVDISSSSVFIVSGTGKLHRLKLSDGTPYTSSWPISIFTPSLEHSFGGVNVLNNYVFITTAGHCDTGNFQGKVFAFNMDSISFGASSTFIPTSPNYGGGLQGSGGVAIDSAQQFVYAAIGASYGGSSTSDGYGENVCLLTYPDLSLLLNYLPTSVLPSSTSDFGASAMLFTPTNGCSTALLAVENRAGYLLITDTFLSLQYQYIQISHANANDFTASPAFDSSRNILYVVNPSESEDTIYLAGLVALQVNDDCSLSTKWNTPLAASSPDNPWPSPIVAGGLVYVSTGEFSQVYAVNADTGVIVWESSEALGHIYASPTVVDGKLFVVDSGSNYDGVSSRLWAYIPQDMVTATPTSSPTAISSSFIITISTSTFDVTSLATTGSPNAITGLYTQKIYTFTDASSNIYYMRLPVAGITSTSGLPLGLTWDYTDLWEDSFTLGYVMLGEYDATSWSQPSSSSLQVNYIKGTYCREVSIYRQTTVKFQCSAGAITSYVFSENSTCI
eukprot:gene12930-27276_t